MEVTLYLKVLIYWLIIFIKQVWKGGKPYIKTPKRIKNVATINQKNRWGNNRCFEYSILVALHHQEDIDNYPERIPNIQFFSHKYKWNGIEFTAGKKDWERFERNNETIALNILFIPHN